MSMPEQIKQQIAEAKRITDEFYKPADDAKSDAEPGTPAADATPAAVAKPVVGEGAPPQAPNIVEEENSQTYAQRWRSLQGSWNSLKHQNDQMSARIGQLEGLISTMQSTPAVAPAPTADSGSLITPKDREDYGQEMVEFAQRVSRQENAAIRAELEQAKRAFQAMDARLSQVQQFVPAVQQVVQTQRLSAEDKFFAEVGRMIPGWEATNNNPEFHRWLLTPDPLSGLDRQTFLADAQKNLDAARVASIFAAFSPGGAGTHTTARPNAAASELERQISPGSSLSAPTPSTQEARRWSRAEIAKLYDDQRRGVFKGREQEFKAQERDLFAAQADGRIAA